MKASGPVQTEIEVARLLDKALAVPDQEAFDQAWAALWTWAYRIAWASLADRDAAQDLTQDALIAVYQAAQQRPLNGEQMVGLMRARLTGWQKIPGLITKYRAEKARRGRSEISIFTPVANAQEDQTLTLGDLLMAPLPPPELMVAQLEEIRQQPQVQLAEVDAKIATWQQRLGEVKNKAARETLQALLAYTQQGRAHVVPGLAPNFQVVIGTGKWRWRPAPTARNWLKQELGLKQEAAVRDRLLRVFDLLRQSGLDRPSVGLDHLAEALAHLRDEARWLWHQPTDRETLRALCRWYQHQLEQAQEGVVWLQPLLLREQSQFILDKDLAAYLQARLNLNRNTVRKRVDRVLAILADWGLVEVIKDE